MTKEYFAYIRISDPKQGKGVSLEAQSDAITQYAAQNGFVICQWFEERKTAAKKGRGVFTSIVEQLQNGKASGLIMHKIDRSARNLSDWAKIGELQDSGVNVHFAGDSLDFASNSGRLTADIHAVMAAHYIRNLRDEALKGLNGRLKQGLYPFKAPIGYLDTGKGNAKKICPTRGPKVRTLFGCYATGEHSLLSLVDEAERIGLKSSKGGKVTKTCIERMIKNPFYVGQMYVWSRGETYKGVHEPLIPVALFQRVQKVRENKSVKKVTKHDRTYRRTFDCKRCGRVYSGEKQKGHVYYRCHTRGCTKGSLREEMIDHSAAVALQGVEISEQHATRLMSFLGQWGQRVLKPETPDTTALEMGKLKRKQEQLLDAYLDGLVDKPTLETRRAQLQLSEQGLSERKQNSLSQEQILAHTADLFELLKSLYLTYSLANSAEKRQILKILFSNRTIDGGNVELAPSIWTRKATNLVTVLLGAHSEDIIRRGEDARFPALADLETLFVFQEWKQIKELHDKMQYETREENFPQMQIAGDYHQAA